MGLNCKCPTSFLNDQTREFPIIILGIYTVSKTFDPLREYLMEHFGWSSKRVSMEMSLTSKDASARYLGKLVLRDHLVARTSDGRFRLADGVMPPGADDFLEEEVVPL